MLSSHISADISPNLNQASYLFAVQKSRSPGAVHKFSNRWVQLQCRSLPLRLKLSWPVIEIKNQAAMICSQHARDANAILEHKYKYHINGTTTGSPKTFFVFTLKVHPQRNPESSIKRMKNAERKAKPRLVIVRPWCSPSMYPHLSSPYCGTEDIFWSMEQVCLLVYWPGLRLGVVP